MRYLVAALGIVLGIMGFVALRDATLSTHQRVDPESQIELVMRVETHRAEHDQTLLEMGEALVLSCRLEVNSDPGGAIEDWGGGLLRTVPQPSMDTTDRRQFRGCLEDWSIDHVRVDVIRLVELPHR